MWRIDYVYKQRLSYFGYFGGGFDHGYKQQRTLLVAGVQSSAPEVASHFKSSIRLFFLMALNRLAGIWIRPGRAHFPRKRRDFRLTRDGDTDVVSVGLDEYDCVSLTTCTNSAMRIAPVFSALPSRHIVEVGSFLFFLMGNPSSS